MFQSVITYKQDTHENILPILKPHVDPSIAIREKITARYHKESPYVVGVISLLLNSIDLFRKTNFCNLNIRPVEKNFLGIDLSSCKISRFIKYLIYEFAIASLKHFRSRYQNYLNESL